ncbi:hypothetical protein [Terricaulis sp.]|uniref:hypothetical protein n=1 Tax=Terricaulis sp. TaxID=2768686 RepID=UPI003783131C
MLLADVNFTLRGQWERDEDRAERYRRAAKLGAAAWASESQFYLLTPFEFGAVCDHLSCGLLQRDFLKVQEVTARFSVAGEFPPAVNVIFEEAQRLGVIELYVSRRALAAPRRRGALPYSQRLGS